MHTHQPKYPNFINEIPEDNENERALRQALRLFQTNQIGPIIQGKTILIDLLAKHQVREL